MKKNQKLRIGKVFSAGFGLVVLAVGLSWLGKSAGLLPADIDPLRYACPACMVLFGVWIIAAQFMKKSGEQADGREDRDAHV